MKALPLKSLILVVLLLGGVFLGSTKLLAATCPNGWTVPSLAECPGGAAGNPADSTAAHYDLKADCSPAAGVNLDKTNCGIMKFLLDVIDVLSAVVGVVIVGVIIFAGIEYSSAGSDAQRVNAARNRVRNAIIALLLFVFMFSFLQWLVPGGII